jgi:hypothetical protein
MFPQLSTSSRFSTKHAVWAASVKVVAEASFPARSAAARAHLAADSEEVGGRTESLDTGEEEEEEEEEDVKEEDC